jgi:hypothetical protein
LVLVGFQAMRDGKLFVHLGFGFAQGNVSLVACEEKLRRDSARQGGSQPISSFAARFGQTSSSTLGSIVLESSIPRNFMTSGERDCRHSYPNISLNIPVRIDRLTPLVHSQNLCSCKSSYKFRDKRQLISID